MLIRPVTLDDKPEWLRMRLALWPDSAPEQEATEMDALLAGYPSPTLMAAFVAPRPEGGEARAERLALLLSLGVRAQGALAVAHGGRQDPGRDAAFQARLQLDTRIAARLRLNMGWGVTVGVVA